MIYDFEGHTPKIDPNSWVAPNAVIIGRVELKKNSNIWFNTTLRGDLEPIIIGKNSNIQDGSILHTDKGNTAIPLYEKLGYKVTRDMNWWLYGRK